MATTEIASWKSLDDSKTSYTRPITCPCVGSLDFWNSAIWTMGSSSDDDRLSSEGLLLRVDIDIFTENIL